MFRSGYPPLLTELIVYCYSKEIHTLYNVCSVHWGMFSTSGGGGGCSVHQGDTMSTLGGYHEYIGGCSVHHRDIMMHVGGYYEYIVGCSVHWGIP